MSAKYILFDVDGTLTDPGEGITNAIMYALEKYGIKVADRSELYHFIGPPLINSFMEFYGFSREEAGRALTYYREYFAPRGIFENRLYDGIPELLSKLKADGRVLLVATSKPEEYTEKILKHFGIDAYFAEICGNTLDEARPTKREVIGYALTRFPDMKSEGCVMVGDRRYDMEGAVSCGITPVGVLFGYGSREELESAGAAGLARDTNELYELLTKKF